MKTRYLTPLVLLFYSVGIAFSQNNAPEGRRYMKKYENNYATNMLIIKDNGDTIGEYNFASKTHIEKLMFSDFNADVEFFIAPSFEGELGFRIFKNHKGQNILQVKKIANYKEIKSTLSKEFKIESMTVYISDDFAQKIYDATTQVVDCYKSIGVPATIFDGTAITFRYVRDNDLASLWIHGPDGEAERLYAIYKQLINDVWQTKTINEAKYNTLLD